MVSVLESASILLLEYNFGQYLNYTHVKFNIPFDHKYNFDLLLPLAHVNSAT
jgi:hypothetical protein